MRVFPAYIVVDIRVFVGPMLRCGRGAAFVVREKIIIVQVVRALSRFCDDHRCISLSSWLYHVGAAVHYRYVAFSVFVGHTNVTRGCRVKQVDRAPGTSRNFLTRRLSRLSSLHIAH